MHPEPAPRYAVYFAPAATSSLWRWGSAWLGRDAEAGETVARPEVPGYDAAALAALTCSPARYGFHATLKPPFRLAPGSAETELIKVLGAFASDRQSFSARPLVVALLDGFVALRPSEPAPALLALADDCVRHFDAFRAPPSRQEITRRLAGSTLTPRQREHLARWGYPYVFDDWRFHMTLTERLGESDRIDLLSALTKLFEPLAMAPLHVGGIALFKQDGPGAPFRLLARAAFRS